MPEPLHDPLLSVVIPVYNEEATLHEIVRRVRAQPWRLEIIAVDDGSTDRSLEILRELEGPDLAAVSPTGVVRLPLAAVETCNDGPCQDLTLETVGPLLNTRSPEDARAIQTRLALLAPSAALALKVDGAVAQDAQQPRQHLGFRIEALCIP